MKPVILIAPDDGFNPMFQAPHTIISSNYTKCVLEAGGIPVVAFDVNCAAEYAQWRMVFCSPGGMSDIHAGNYGQIYKDRMGGPNHPLNDCGMIWTSHCFAPLWRRANRYSASAAACRFVNVVQGGSLYMDLPEETGQDHEKENHTVVAEPDSFVCAYGTGEQVVSRHHQGMKSLGRDLKICAKSPDGLPEAIEHTSLPVFAVQWHPEQSQTQADKSCSNV